MGDKPALRFMTPFDGPDGQAASLSNFLCRCRLDSNVLRWIFSRRDRTSLALPK
jgi:hypothetical protein